MPATSVVVRISTSSSSTSPRMRCRTPFCRLCSEPGFRYSSSIFNPTAAIDYEMFNELPDRKAMTGEWLAYCSACPVPEIANVLLRANVAFHQVTGVLDDESTWTEIEEWIHAAKVKKTLEENRLGLMGHYYSGMLDIQTDLTRVSIVFGSHIEHLEVDELSALRSDVSEQAINIA